MGRKSLTAKQRAYRKQKREEKLLKVRLRDGTTRLARTHINLRLPRKVKAKMEELCLDRVLSQGQLVTDQIHRCLPVALSGLKGGRAARRKLQDTVQVCLPISNVALEVLNNYCKVTGKTKAVVVTEIILATALVTETDHLSARAYFTRDQRICEYWNQETQEECEYRWIVERIERELEEEYGTL